MKARDVLAGSMSERALLAFVREAAGRFGWATYHTHDSRRSEAGFPDLVLVRGGELLFAELKAGRGRLTEAQREWLDALAATGAEVHVWRPGDVDELLERLKPPRGEVRVMAAAWMCNACRAVFESRAEAVDHLDGHPGIGRVVRLVGP